jgi:hypothetical protein
MRRAVANIERYIATVEVSRHKPFVFVRSNVCPDHKIYVVASNDAFILGVLSSRFHLTWALNAGGRLGVGNDPTWTSTTCFAPFPFPAADAAQQARIRAVAEELDAHRKRQQALHLKLTLTDMYNVLAKLRAGEPLDKKDKTVHEQGLVSVLRQLHDELDALVAEAYGWPADLPDEEILARLVALNAERAAEEAAGVIRWLRPEYQVAGGTVQVAGGMLQGAGGTLHAAAAAGGKAQGVREGGVAYEARLPWPERLAEQAQAVRAALVALEGPATAEQVAAAFVDAPVARVAEVLEMLAGLGQAALAEDGRFAAA